MSQDIWKALSLYMWVGLQVFCLLLRQFSQVQVLIFCVVNYICLVGSWTGTKAVWNHVDDNAVSLEPCG